MAEWWVCWITIPEISGSKLHDGYVVDSYFHAFKVEHMKLRNS